MGIIGKNQMSEEDVKLNCVSPKCRRIPALCFVSGSFASKDLYEAIKEQRICYPKKKQE